jgi:hypothetical protein
MSSRLVQVGDAHAVIVDRALLDRLGISAETALEVTADGASLRITPRFSVAEHRQRVRAAAEHVLTKHQATFEKLAL